MVHCFAQAQEVEMGYWDEAQKLYDETVAKTEALMEQYKEYRNPGMLDGEPWEAELREIDHAFYEGLKALWEKYPDWENEEKPQHIKDLAAKHKK